MGKMIQIRNVPEPLHRRLRARAAALGLSLSDYLLREEGTERLADHLLAGRGAVHAPHRPASHTRSQARRRPGHRAVIELL